MSYPHTGAYGTDWIKTPGFDRVAKEGLLFTRAYTPNAKCSPSRSIIITGRNSWQLEEAANHVPFFPEKFLSHVEVLGAMVILQVLQVRVGPPETQAKES